MTDPAGLAWTWSRHSNRRYVAKRACPCTVQVPLDGFHPVALCLRALVLPCLAQHHVKPQSRASGGLSMERILAAPFSSSLQLFPGRPVSLYGS